MVIKKNQEFMSRKKFSRNCGGKTN